MTESKDQMSTSVAAGVDGSLLFLWSLLKYNISKLVCICLVTKSILPKDAN